MFGPIPGTLIYQESTQLAINVQNYNSFQVHRKIVATKFIFLQNKKTINQHEKKTIESNTLFPGQKVIHHIHHIRHS